MRKISFSLTSFTQNELASHFFVFLVYFFLLALLRFKLDLGLFWLLVGGLVGTYILDVDHLIYWFVSHPEKEDSGKALEITRRIRGIRGIRDIAGELYQLGQQYHNEHLHMVFHTISFQLILLILTVYVLSSSGSYFGAGLVLAINLHLLKDIWQDYVFRGKEALADYFLWQIKGWGVERYLKEYLILVSLVFGLISLVFI